LRVLFVSKPIAPPWHDGSKNLVRDVASHLTRARPTVLSVPGAASLGERVTMEPVYADPGRFTPAALANARVLRRLMTGDPHDLWHFVFAPNVASSSAAKVAYAARRALGWRGKIVQTIASAPRSFDGVSRLLFGHTIVALSEWTRAALIGAGAPSKQIIVIPPCAAAPHAVTEEARARVRQRLDLGTGPIVLYPGDYEVSTGADTVARAVASIAREIPEVRVVFACRPKTKDAATARDRIIHELDSLHTGHRTRHVGELDDLAPLLSAASVVVFPVDNLYGKVDLPLVVLEALALGIPLVLARGGPLEAIPSARFVDPGDDAALARATIALLQRPGDAGAAGQALWKSRFAPPVVAAAYDDVYDGCVRGSVVDPAVPRP
jgi:phosphatidylinositol alpha-1,6-mannosyltransferase